MHRAAFPSIARVLVGIVRDDGEKASKDRMTAPATCETSSRAGHDQTNAPDSGDGGRGHRGEATCSTLPVVLRSA